MSRRLFIAGFTFGSLAFWLASAIQQQPPPTEVPAAPTQTPRQPTEPEPEAPDTGEPADTAPRTVEGLEVS